MIKYILFDMDNTLYSPRFKVEDAVGERMNKFLADFLDIPIDEAVRLRQTHVPKYGTTMQWLVAEKGFTDIDGMYAAAYPDGEADSLFPDPELRTFLTQLPVPYAILTNSPMEHVHRVLDRLAVRDLFSHIFDIRWAGLKGKPSAETFRRVLETVDAEPETTLFVDDYPLFVEGFLNIGGKGILIDEENRHPQWPHAKIRELTELLEFLD
ncbi:HAD-IA family hydrolase [Breznakiella homolactica]|uniref:HAD-IA family hydrolase n=1 Tax=Breznakiella homolactica TaxID=2798577 RepID=A0A7T7XMK8_9SPIR|nr:HAD-IA family hydrolase [Breznakiella homolactica]QQO09115.1 HAD-IA family hydrolase [Breznakiella homolactica]